MADNTLVCPFLDESPTYAYGVEFGMLYAKMRDPSVERIADYFCTENQEQITLAANRLGWKITFMEQWYGGPGWMWVRMIRKSIAD